MIRQVIFDVGGVLLDFDPDAMVSAATRDPAAAALLRREIFSHSDWNRLDRGEGEEPVFRSMKSRLPRELWPQALTEAGDSAEGIDAFLRKRFRGITPDRKELKRASDALARRGYNWNEIREGLNRYGAGIEEDL